MKVFRVALYKAKIGDGKFIDDGISVYTSLVNIIGLLCVFNFKLAWEIIKRRYSHIEIWWKTTEQEWFDEKGIATGMMFTSTMRQDMAGTVVRPAQEVLTHLDRWDCMEIEVDDSDYWDAICWAYRQAKSNKGYNVGTILNFFNPLRTTQRPSTDDKNICSVAAQGFCWIAGVFESWIIWSPIKLWWKLYNLGYKTFSLTE